MNFSVNTKKEIAQDMRYTKNVSNFFSHFPSRLKSKTKVKRHAICRRFRSNNNVLVRFANACTHFGLTISLKKSTVLAPAIAPLNINNY